MQPWLCSHVRRLVDWLLSLTTAIGPWSFYKMFFLFFSCLRFWLPLSFPHTQTHSCAFYYYLFITLSLLLFSLNGCVRWHGHQARIKYFRRLARVRARARWFFWQSVSVSRRQSQFNCPSMAQKLQLEHNWNLAAIFHCCWLHFVSRLITFTQQYFICLLASFDFSFVCSFVLADGLSVKPQCQFHWFHSNLCLCVWVRISLLLCILIDVVVLCAF